MRRTLDPRGARILFNTTSGLKEQLQQLAKEQDLSLSYLCHLAIEEWLEALDGLSEIVAKMREDKE